MSAVIRAHRSSAEPAQEEAEVVAGGGEDGVDAVAVATLEMVAAHAVLGLEMTDDRLDRGSALHLAADGFGDVADLAADPNPELVRMIVAAIALMDAAGLDAGQPLQIGDDRPEGVAIERIAVQRLGMEDKLAAPGLGRRRRHRDLASELIGSPRLARADAFDLGRVQRIDLGATLAVVLEADTQGKIEQRAAAALQLGIAVDLAADVADGAARDGCAGT